MAQATLARSGIAVALLTIPAACGDGSPPEAAAIGCYRVQAPDAPPGLAPTWIRLDTLPRFEGRAWLAVADTSGGYHRRYGEWRLPSTDSVEIMLGDSMDRVAMELARTSQGLAGIAEYITDVVGPPRRWQINAIREDCDVARRERSNVSFKLPGE